MVIAQVDDALMAAKVPRSTVVYSFVFVIDATLIKTVTKCKSYKMIILRKSDLSIHFIKR